MTPRLGAKLYTRISVGVLCVGMLMLMFHTVPPAHGLISEGGPILAIYPPFPPFGCVGGIWAFVKMTKNTVPATPISVFYPYAGPGIKSAWLLTAPGITTLGTIVPGGTTICFFPCKFGRCPFTPPVVGISAQRGTALTPPPGF